MINSEADLKRAFEELGDDKGTIWLRASSIGGGGKGALPTSNFNFAKGWIEHFDGYGDFVAAELLTSNTITWVSIWHEGELVVAQTRVRKGWVHGNRTLSGVTGVTKVGQTASSDEATEVALKAIKAVSAKPHGIFAVDMTYDKNGVPNPTEINIARFFTTILFFTEAGLNMPKIFKDIILYNEFPDLKKKINPLADGLLWLRGMDRTPVLTTSAEIEAQVIFPK
jgi:carbamoyl-phosphate synthase large subunit